MRYLKENNIPLNVLEFEADFAPFQPKGQKAVNGVKTLQFSNDHDDVANNRGLLSPFGKIEGAEVTTNSDPNKGHSILDFVNQIYNLPTGDYVIENGQIVPKK